MNKCAVLYFFSLMKKYGWKSVCENEKIVWEMMMALEFKNGIMSEH